MIRQANERDFEAIITLCKSFFRIHNLFYQNQKKVIAYLKKQVEENQMFLCEDNGKITGVLILVKTGQDSAGKHTVWKFRHFAYSSEKAATTLLAEAERKVQKASKTAKIELTIAENERGRDLFKANGYQQEGALRNHYRPGETCYIISKSFC